MNKILINFLYFLLVPINLGIVLLAFRFVLIDGRSRFFLLLPLFSLPFSIWLGHFIDEDDSQKGKGGSNGRGN